MIISYVVCFAALVLTGAAALPHPPSPPSPLDRCVFDNATIFSPPSSWASKSTSYARTVVLSQDCEEDDPVLLASWSFSPPGRPYTPIYQSNDGGRTWSDLAHVFFSAASGPSGGGIWQTFLYELPQNMGRYPKGTILLTGNAIPSDFSSTNIQLYASLDRGRSFEFVSTVATGGGPNTTNGATSIWEPMILTHDGQVGVFYSDSRDPKHGQKLAHQTSRDLLNWGPVVNDAAYANYTLRPGMTTIAKMGNGKFIFSYELALSTIDPVNAPYATHYRIADSPFEFDSATPYLLKATDGTISSAGPQTVWTSAGGPKGTIVTSDSTYDELFINREYGHPDAWIRVPSGHGVGYTRFLQVMPNTQEKVILLTNGGMYGRPNTMVTTGDYVVPGPGSPEHPSRGPLPKCRGTN